tara:strand:- start:24 stop:188 length:165 start_codon:yes stop_codon:yes gene_type:complete
MGARYAIGAMAVAFSIAGLFLELNTQPDRDSFLVIMILPLVTFGGLILMRDKTK